MEAAKLLTPEQLCRGCDPAQFPFETTAEIDELTEVVGQARAIEAVQFGIGIARDGYNLFCLGPAGVGKHFIARQFLERHATAQPVPPDWCYINNFEQPQKPVALQLPSGQGAILRGDCEQLVEELRSAIPAAFESEEYRTRKQMIETELKERHEKAFEAVRRKAEKKEIALLRTPTGFVFAPIKNGEVLGPEEFERLPEPDRRRLEADVEALQRELQASMREAPQWEKEGREKVKELNHQVTRFAVGHLIDALRAKYSDLSAVCRHFDAIEQDVIENVDEFLKPPENPLAALIGVPQRRAPKGSPFFRRYEVNLLVDHSTNHGSPVVFEDNPTFQNLHGQVEYTAQFGALVTDFNLIRAGALHRANGGYLILEVRKLLQHPYAYEGLKRALQSAEIRIESLGEMLGWVSTVTLQPQRIPLRLKVVLLGERLLYYLLAQYDPEFSELFKVAADFEDRMERTPESSLLYARLIGTLAKKENLLPLDRSAVARVMEQSAREAGDSQKLSTHSRALLDLLREADYWARSAGRPSVSAPDVTHAIDAQTRRSDRVRERLQEEVVRGTIRIETERETVGQVNGLSVLQLGQFAFGHPSRITARVRLGRGEVVDIEREVELGGPIHSKGVLILSSFLGARYASDRPLSLSASLVFEQSYGGVEGDSASSAELYALLSALADVPIRQCFAVTGSVDQQGQVQAIGGVNEKIEGFFDLCKARGLTGRHGVLIPASNVKHLMLRRDVVEAVRDGKFHIYAVETIDQGIAVLTGKPAGERDSLGRFPEGSVNHSVEARLIELAEKRRQFGQTGQAAESAESKTNS
jgi:lon-related putative ATP-dependent protease